MAAGRVDLSGGSKSKPAPAKSSGGAMGKNDKIKLGIAVGALAIGGLVMGWYFGAFDSFLQPKVPDGPTIGGSPVTAEQKAEYDEVQKKNYEEHQKAQEAGATSAGS